MKIDPELIRYLEESQGMKFKKIPQRYKDYSGHGNSHSEVEFEEVKVKGKKITKIVRTGVYIDHTLFKKGMEKARDLETLHEAREVLLVQNHKNPKLTTHQRASVHIAVTRHLHEDKRFLNEYYKGYFKQGEYQGFGITHPDWVYDFSKYRRRLK